MIQSTLLAALEAAFQAAVKAEVEAQLVAFTAQLDNRLAQLVVNHSSVSVSDMTALRERLDGLECAVEMKELDYATLAESLSDEQLRQIARRVSPSDIAATVDWSEEIDYSGITSALDYSELANEINYSELSSEIDAAQWANQLDLDERLRDILSGRTVTIQL